MTTTVKRLRRVIDNLQEIVDAAEAREATKIKTCPNTYGLNEFVSLESDGFLNLNADVDDLIEDPEFDDDDMP